MQPINSFIQTETTLSHLIAKEENSGGSVHLSNSVSLLRMHALIPLTLSHIQDQQYFKKVEFNKQLLEAPLILSCGLDFSSSSAILLVFPIRKCRLS